MPTKQRKTRKMRGKGTHGYGSKKKHRGKGSKGGKGYAGSHKHKITYIMKHEPEHFGKSGFTSLKKSAKVINVGDLEAIEKAGEVNLSEMGYDKLLGKGVVTMALSVTVENASKKAKEKLEKAGGKLITASEDEWEDSSEQESEESAAEKPEEEE